MVTDQLSASKYLLSQVNPRETLIFYHVSFVFISLRGEADGVAGTKNRGAGETGRIGEAG